MNLITLRISSTILTYYILNNVFKFSPFSSLIQNAGYFVLLITSCWCISRYIIGKFYVSKKILPPNNKTVLITGCDSGFGLNLALQLANLNYCVFCSCLQLDSEGSKKLIELKKTKNIFVFQLDVTSDESVDKCYEFVKNNLPENQKLWALVNNAGVGYYNGSLWNDNNLKEIYQPTFDVNVFGIIRMTNKFVPLLYENPNSRIIFLCSYAGIYTMTVLSSYCMSKHAVRSYGNALRRELNNNIKVILIEPSLYKTEITNLKLILDSLHKNWSKTNDDLKRKIGLKKLNENLRISEKLVRSSKSRIQDVIDVLLDSICLENPYPIYRVGNWKERIMFYILEFLPDDFQDWFLDGFLYEQTVKLLDETNE